MSLTPERFNKIALKTDLENLASKDDLQEMKKEILSAIEGWATNVKDVRTEQISNLPAHDRFEERITKIEKHLDLKQTVRS